MNENTDNTNPSPDDIPQPTPPQEPTPLYESTPPEPPQQASPPPEFDASAPPIPPQEPTPQTGIPQPPVVGELSKDDKMWGMFCHLAAFAGYIGIPFGSILGPLILWLIKKEEIAFVDDQGKESLNFQISIAIYGLALLPTMCFPPLLIVLALALSIAAVVFIIIAAIKANNGEAYRYPCCLRFVK